MKAKEMILHILSKLGSRICSFGRKKALAAAACLAAGALLSVGGAWGSRGVFLPAFVSLLPAGFGAAAAVGGILGSVAFGLTAQQVAAIAAAICAILVRLWFDNAGHTAYSLSAAIVSGIAFLSGRILECAVGRMRFEDYLMGIAASALCMAGVYLCASVFKTPSLLDINTAGEVRITALAALAVCALCPVEILGLNFGWMLYFIAAVYALYTCDRRDAAIFSAAASLGLTLFTQRLEPSGLFAVIYTAVCPYFIKKNRFSCSIYQALFVIVLSAFIDGGYDFRAALSACAAGIVFAIIPGLPVKELNMRIGREKVSGLHGGGRLKILSDGLCALIDSCRLDDGENTVKSLSQTREDISVGDMVYAGVCAGCEQHRKCFDQGSTEAQDMLLNLDGFQDDSQDLFLPFCSHSSVVTAAAHRARKRLEYMSEVAGDRAKRRIEFETALCAVSQAVEDMSPGINDVGTEISLELSKLGIDCMECRYDGDGCAELYLSAGARINDKRLAETVSAVVGKRLEILSRYSADGVVRLTLAPEPKYKLEVGAYQIAKKPGSAIGDALLMFETGKYSYVLISDGMGTGEEAQKSAITLVETVKSLIEAGFSEKTALMLSSERLKCASSEESLATLDMLCVNLISGFAKLYKCGAGQSYVKTEKDFSLIPSGGYPLGIIDELSAACSDIDAGAPCEIVLVTDGAASLPPDKVKTALSDKDKLDCTETAARIAHAAFSFNGSLRADDVTAAVVRLYLNEPEK